MGILSIVFSGANFIGFPTAIVGLILGYVARNQSRKAGVYNNTLAKVGIILGWIAVALTVIGVAGILIFTAVAGQAISSNASDAANCISSSNSYSSSSEGMDCSPAIPEQDGQSSGPDLNLDDKGEYSPMDRFG